MALTVEIVGQEQVIAHLRSMSDGVRQNLKRAVIASSIDVQARSREKLAGEVLNERTHHLHDSVHYELVQDDAGGIVAKVGTDVVYARFWECGFSGTETVREHLRRQSVAFGKPIVPVDVLVKQHARKVNQAPRSFLGSALAELEPQIRDRLEQAVQQAVKQ